MRRTRLLAVVAVGVSALLALPAQAAPKAPKPLVLRGTTIVTAAHTSTADLVLYEDALVRVAQDFSTPDTTMTGKGRLIAFSLQAKGGSDSLSQVRFRKDGRDAVRNQVNGSFYPKPQNCRDYNEPIYLTVCDDSPPGVKWARLHQGHYRLRVLTDGAPVTVRVHLQGVKGTARYATSTRFPGGVVAVPALSLTAPQYQRFQTRLALPADAQVYLNTDAAWSKNPLAAGVGWCRYPASRAELPTDYASECPGGETQGHYSPFINVAQARWNPNAMFGLQESWLPKGTHRVGFSVSDTGGVTMRTALIGWMGSS